VLQEAGWHTVHNFLNRFGTQRLFCTYNFPAVSVQRWKRSPANWNKPWIESALSAYTTVQQLDIILTDDAEPERVRIFGATACSAYEKETQVQGGGGRRRWAADEYYG
jgi:hypothetical protein